MDEITLYRKLDNEYIPRFYTLTGGDFGSMLEAVKALPFRRFDDIKRAWLVRKDGIETLRGAGYTVTEQPMLRLNWFDRAVEYITYLPGGQPDIRATVTVFVEYRDETGAWKSAPFHKTLDLSDRVAEAQATPHFDSALRNVGRTRAREYFDTVVLPAFAAALSRRDKDGWLTAMKAVSEAMKKEYVHATVHPAT